jgi:hypothetical protein
MGLPTQQMQMRTATSPQATPAKGKGGCGGDCNKCKGNSPDTYTDGAGACMFPTTPALISWLQQNFPNMFNGGMVQQSISQGKLDTGGTIFGVIPPPNQPIISDLDDYNNLVGQTLDNTITAASGAVGTGIYAGNTGPTLDQIALQSASWLDTLYNAGVAAGAL